MTGDWVVQAIGADPETLNPVTGQDATGADIRSNIFESLLQMDNYTLKLKPQLAETCETSADQLVYTFHLRHDVKWQDGTPFTAADVKYSYDRVQDPKVDAAQVRVYFSTVKSCDVLDPYTVRFTTKERYFKMLETIGGMPIVPEHAFSTGNPDFNKNEFGRKPIGTGPYKFVRWDTGAQIVLERDDSYWGGPGHYPKRLVYQVISEPYVVAELLKKGEVDLAMMSPLIWKHELEQSRSMSRLKKIVFNYPAYNYLGFNLRRPIFADIRVRQAIDLLIPRDDILAKIFLNEYATKTAGYDLPSSPSYNQDVKPTAYDPVAAVHLLHQAGWEDSRGDGILYKDGQPLTFSIVYPAGGGSGAKVLELVQESLKRAGIDVKLERLQWAQMEEKVNDWNFDMSMQGWALDINGDPSQLWDGSQAKIKKSSNFIGYSNPAADKLIAAGRLEYDDAKRAAIYRDLHKIIHDDCPVCFLFNPRQILLVSNRYENVKMFAPRPCYDVSTWWVPHDRQRYGE